jgi:hypothetical protein
MAVGFCYLEFDLLFLFSFKPFSNLHSASIAWLLCMATNISCNPQL